MTRLWFGLIGVGGAALLAASSSGATAQAPAAPLCRAFEEAIEPGGPRVLQVVCAKAGTVLGRVDAYQMSPLPALKAAVVVASLDRSRRVWLVTSEGERSLGVEEITGTIARAAGRGASTRLDGLELGFGDGATGQLTAGIMSVRDRKRGGAAGQVDLGQLVARMRAIRASSPSRSGE